MHRDLNRYSLERLTDEIPGEATSATAHPVDEPSPHRRRSFRNSSVVRLARRIVNRLLRPFVSYLVRKVREEEIVNTRDIEDRVDALRTEVDWLWPRVSVGELEVNQELLKAQLANVYSAVEEIGRAISPGEGAAGASRQFAEFRQQLNGLDRRVRQIRTYGAVGGDQLSARTGLDTGVGAGVHPTASSDSFDYVGFEHRFRGDPDEICRRTFERYPNLKRESGLVLDVGCGRGEMLAELAECGVDGVGVDLDPEMAAEARERGVTVHIGDAISFLASVPEETYTAITAIQVVEHLELDQLIELLGLVCTRLKPGGMFIAETPNPTSMIVLSRSYILDPTHVWPLHPSLLTFLCERAAFLTVEERFFSPAEEMYLELLKETQDSPEMVRSLNRSLSQLNHVLFGPQDYAIVATRK